MNRGNAKKSFSFIAELKVLIVEKPYEMVLCTQTGNNLRLSLESQSSVSGTVYRVGSAQR